MRLIFILYIVGPTLMADWGLLLKANTADELLKAEKQFEKEDELRRRCRFELDQALFPDSCLHEIAQLLGQPISSHESALPVLWNKVRAICRKGADEIQTIVKVMDLLNLKMPKSCRRALFLRMQDLLYLQNKKGTVLEINQAHENFDRTESQF